MILKDESSFKAYYVCFERPCGSQIWTLASRRPGTVFISMNRKDAATFAKQVTERRGNCSRVHRILLPASTDDHIYADIDF
jgi:hypothetical protein